MPLTRHGARRAVLAWLAVASPAVAQTPVRLPAEDNVLTGKPTPIFGIGRDEGEEWEILGRVVQVAFDRNDNLYVYDASGPRITVYDASGKFVRQIGQKGEGPGEYMNPAGFVLLSNGNIAVQDNANYHLFGPDGKYLRTAMRPQAGGVFILGGLGLTGVVGDAVLSRGRAPIPGFDHAPPGADGTVKLPIVLDRLDETVTRSTLYEISQPAPKVEQQQAGPGGRGRMIMTRTQAKVFQPEINLAALPGAAVISHDAGYRLVVVNADGSVARVLERPLTPRKVTKRDQDRARDYERERLRTTPMPRISFSGSGGTTIGSAGGSMSEDEINKVLQQLEFADEIAVIRKLLGDPRGQIWVERTANQDPYAQGPIDILDVSGRYIGTLRDQPLPSAISPSGRAAYVVKDEMDVQRVEVRQLPAAWR
jgi:hypothetical protein